MAHKVPESRMVDGDMVTPTEWNAEVSSILGEFNGRLDRDNLPANVMTHDKFALGTFHQIKYVSSASVPSLTRTADAITTWADVPDLSTTITTGDSRLVLKARASGFTFATLGVFVDGRLVCVGAENSASGFVVGSVAVAAGVHDVRVKFLSFGGWGARDGGRALMVRECVR